MSATILGRGRASGSPDTNAPQTRTADRVGGRYRARIHRRGGVVALTLAALVGTLTVGAAPASAAPPMPPTPNFGSAIDGYARYEPQTTCEKSAKPGVAAFYKNLSTTYGRYAHSIGRDCNQGKRSEHKEGRALDWSLNANSAADRDIAAHVMWWLHAADGHGNAHANARRLGIMYIIWNRQVWKSYDPVWRPYTGDDPHTDHIHFSFSWAGARQQTSWWTSGLTTGTRTMTQGMTGYDVACLQHGLNAAAYLSQGAFTPPGNATGTFNATTRASVMSFQRWAAFTANGEVGRYTGEHLTAVLSMNRANATAYQWLGNCQWTIPRFKHYAI